MVKYQGRKKRPRSRRTISQRSRRAREKEPRLLNADTHTPKQKELEAQREAGLLRDAVQEASSAEEISNSVVQTSSVETYSEHAIDLEHRTLPDTNSSLITLSSVALKDNYTLPFEENAVENSSAIQKTSSAQTYSEHLNDLVYRTPPDNNIVQVISNVSQEIRSSQASLSSSTVKDNHMLSFPKCSDESTSAVQQTFSTQTNSKHLNDLVYKTPQDNNMVQVFSMVPQNISSSQASLSSSTLTVKDDHTLSFSKCAVKNSSTAQQASNIEISSKQRTYPRTSKDTNKNTPKIISIHPKDAKSLLASGSSAPVKDIYKSPYMKSFLENRCTVQKTSNLRTYSKNDPVHKTPQGSNIIKTISSVPKDKNSSTVSFSSAAAKDNSILPFARNPVRNSSAKQTVSNNDLYTLPLASNTDTNLPVGSNFGPHSMPKILSAGCSSLPVVSTSSYDLHRRKLISKDHSSILPINSTTVKDTNPFQTVSHHSVATQVNFDSLKSKTTKLRPLPNEAPIRGRRIIDFQYFLRALKEVNNHSEVGCNLNNMIITSEKRSGICTSYVLKCVVCNFEKEIWSENQSDQRNLNTEFVSAVLSIKCSYENVNALFAKMRLPSLIHVDFLKEVEKVGFPSKSVDNKGTNQNISEENYQEKRATVHQCSSVASSNSSLLKEVDLDDLLVEDQFEIKEENAVEDENESETIISDERVSISDDKEIDGEEQTIFPTIIKQEIISDDEDLANSTTNETSNKESIFDEDKQSDINTVLLQHNEAKTCENRMIVNKEQVSLQENVMVGRIQDSSTEHNAMEITEKERMTPFDNESDSELTLKKAKTVTHKEMNDLADAIGFQKKTIKHEINSDYEDLTSSATTETPSKENIIENDEQSILRIVLPQQNADKTCENAIINQEQVNLHQNVMVESILNSNISDELECNAVEITDKESMIHFDKEPDPELPRKKARTVTYEELNNQSVAPGIQTTAPSKGIIISQSWFESNGLVTTAATSPTITGGNVPQTITSGGSIAAKLATTSGNTSVTSMTNAGNVNATSSMTNAGNVAYLIPVQQMATSIGNEALILPQMPQNISSGTYQDARGAAFIPGTSTIIQQHTDQSSGVLPLVSMQQPWTNNIPTNINNPLIIFSDASGAAYMPGVPAAIQQPASASTATYVPFTSTVVQQPVNSSNITPGAIPVTIRPPASFSNVSSVSRTTFVPIAPAVAQQPASSLSRPHMNTDGRRWIGRGNMSSNNPFCTLPGGAPKGASDPATPKSDSDQFNHQSKRPRFRCNDCDITFAKHESWDFHKKNYCIKRLKLPPSSTVTNHALQNNTFPENFMAASLKPHIEQLLSAMAIKRSFLEASIKTALDAQYVINLHKSVQDLTQKSFQELDNALNREKSLMPESSLEEQQFFSEARAQALIRAEAAYKQEKHSAAAVEQALYRQKTAIEATLAATGHEQTALISIFKGLKVPANWNDMSSTCQIQCSGKSFNQEKVLGTSLAETAEQQQVVDSISSKSTPVHTISQAHVSRFNIPSEKLSTVNFEESKAITMNIPSNYSPQYKEINPITSYTGTNAPSFQSCKMRLPIILHSQTGLNLNVSTSAETTSSTPEYEKETMSPVYSNLENTYVTVYQANKCVT